VAGVGVTAGQQRTELWMGRKAPWTMRGNMARILATGSSFSSAVSRNGKHLQGMYLGHTAWSQIGRRIRTGCSAPAQALILDKALTTVLLDATQLRVPDAESSQHAGNRSSQEDVHTR